MVKKYLTILFLFSTLTCFSQCTPVGTATQNNCIQQLIDTVYTGWNTTQCLNFHPLDGNLHFSFIIVNSSCGPVSPYAQLTLEIFNATCDSLIDSARISPPDWDYHTLLDPSQDYVLCYSWKANCGPQVSFCPIIQSSPLPVEWLYSRAFVNNKVAHIQWATASEMNCKYFVLQKADKKLRFYEIDTIEGSGTTSTKTEYEIVDLHVDAINFYRILQYDYNGECTRTGIVRCTNKETNPVECFYYNVFGQPAGNDYLKLEPGYYFEKCVDDQCTSVVKILE